MKVKTGMIMIAAVLLLMAFAVPSIKAEVPSSPDCAAGLIYGRVLCLDGSPISGAYVQVRYWCTGEDLASPGHLIHTLTNAYGCYRFDASQFGCEVDYGWVRVTHGMTKTSPPFNHVPFSWNCHFLCGNPHMQPVTQVEHGIPIPMEPVVNQSETSQTGD